MDNLKRNESGFVNASYLGSFMCLRRHEYVYFFIFISQWLHVSVRARLFVYVCVYVFQCVSTIMTDYIAIIYQNNN